MTRRDRQRLVDIEAAIAAIRGHVGRGGLDDGMVFDAVRMRLIEIGEAVKDLPSSLLDSEPELPWPEIAGMRDRLAHRYFDTSHAIVSATVEEDLPDLEQVVQRLKARAAGVELSDDLVVAIDAALGDGPVTKPTLAPLATEGVLHRSA